MVLHSASTLLCCEEGWPRCLRKYDKQALLGRDFFKPSSPKHCCVIEVCWSPQMNGMDMAWRNVVESSFGDSLKNHEGFLLSSSSTVLLYYLLQNRFILAFLPSFSPERICQHVCCSITKRIRKSSLLSGECVPGFIIELPGNERNHRCK